MGAHLLTAQSARVMAVSLPVPLQGPPPHRECAPALDTQLLRTRFGWSKLAILLLPNTLPNAYCYANACLEDFAAVGTATAFKGKDKLSTLQSSPDMASNPSTTTNACGRANAACAAAPSTWNGGEATFTKCTKTNAGQQVDCTAADLKGQLGMLPSA